MRRAFFMGFALVAYAIFFATFLYLIAFVANLSLIPVTVDRGPAAPVATAIVVDLVLIALFGIQHSVMARQGFKKAWTRIVPEPAERSVYVLAASTMLIVMMAFWRPIDAVMWSVTTPALAMLLWGLFGLGWLIVLTSTFLLNHFELFGLQQAWFHWRGKTAAAPRMRTPFFYKLVRHPLYSGFILAFWAIPTMTFGHLLLAAGMSAYILIAIGYEERDLGHLFGHEYDEYRERVGMLAPGIGRARKPSVPHPL
jgi:protein-S-isoprenylcysteine O-methyltransferase Ste14